MQITRIVIDNFRSIKHLEFEPSQICALIGPNNAGKTNILLAIQRVVGRDWTSARDFSEEDVFGHDPNLDISISITVDPPIRFARYQASEPVDISILRFEYKRYKIGPEKGQRRLEQTCLGADEKPVFIHAKAPKKGERPSFIPLTGMPREVQEQIPVIFIDTNRALADHLPSARYSLLRQLFEDIDRGFHDPSEVMEVTLPDGTKRSVARADRFKELITESQNVLRTRDFETLEQSIKKNALEQLGFDPVKEADKLDLFFAPLSTLDFYKQLELRVREGTFTINATELGGGIQNALVLAILRVYEERRKKGAILLIEEPEMFLHPQMQRSLYKSLRKIGETNQVIYTSHSPHFVTIPDFEEITIVRKTDSGTEVTKSNLPITPARREKIRKELDPERNEMFFGQRVLFVEGDTEKLAFPAYAKRMDLDLDRSGATIVEVGGKKNLLEMANIAMSLNISVGILYDKDSSDFQGPTKTADETAYNNSLDQLADGSESRKVWMLTNNFEDHLRATFGDKEYEAACTKFGGVTKAIRGRLIAEQETQLPIPKLVEEILLWLSS